MLVGSIPTLPIAAIGREESENNMKRKQRDFKIIAVPTDGLFHENYTEQVSSVYSLNEALAYIKLRKWTRKVDVTGEDESTVSSRFYGRISVYEIVNGREKLIAVYRPYGSYYRWMKEDWSVIGA